MEPKTNTLLQYFTSYINSEVEIAPLESFLPPVVIRYIMSKTTLGLTNGLNQSRKRSTISTPRPAPEQEHFFSNNAGLLDALTFEA